METLRFRVAVVGGGLAGLALVNELGIPLSEVAILESGGPTPTPSAEAQKLVFADGIQIKPDSRVRQVGGSSTSWSGLLSLMDTSDFLPVEGLDDGWPVDFEELRDHIDAISSRYGFPPAKFFGPEEALSRMDFPLPKTLEAKVFRVQEPPLRFATFAPVLTDRGLTMLTHHTAVGLKQAEGESGVMRWDIECRLPDGGTRVVQADTVVLAMGAIEIGRMLLQWRHSIPQLQWLPAVGRFFMNHPKGKVGHVRFTKRVTEASPLFNIGDGSFPGFIGLRHRSRGGSPSRENNSYLRLIPILSTSARALKMAMIAARRSLDFFDHSKLAAKGSQKTTMRVDSGGLDSRQRLATHRGKKRFPLRVAEASVQCHADMLPVETNRITLSREKDLNGVPYPVVKHRLSEIDVSGISNLLDAFEDTLRANGVGRVLRQSAPIEECVVRDASHHLGGARMGRDQSSSVVNPDLQVHGLPGLYVLGGAVFPTGGNANPSLTIVALARRLAIHLNQSLSRK